MPNRRQSWSPRIVKLVLIALLLIGLAATGAAQPAARTRPAPSQQPAPSQSAPTQPQVPGFEELNKYPGLLEEFAHWVDKLQRTLQFPPPRNQSRLLPLLPESSLFFLSSSNYGDVAHQLLLSFHEELQESAVLRNWWTHSEMVKDGPKLEDAVRKFYEVSQYLGDEVVVSAAVQGKDPAPLVVAEIRKPGLKESLQRILAETNGSPAIRLVDAAQLVAGQVKKGDLLILVRSDYVVASVDPDALRDMNTRLDSGSKQFATTPFGQRIAQSYQGGLTGVTAADLQSILRQIPRQTGKEQADFKAFQRSGFADMKYFVWEHRKVGPVSLSETELSFTGPRHGIAAWLGSPAPLGSLSFVSPKPVMSFTLVLDRPAQIYEDIKQLATDSNPNAFAGVEQTEQGLKISLKNDLLAQLSGEITIELDRSDSQSVAWRALLGVKDPIRLQQTLGTMFASNHMAPEQFQAGGDTFYALPIPAGPTTTEIAYTFVDGYLVLGSSRANAMEAVRLHRGAQGLATSPSFLANLPPGHTSAASLLVYQDQAATMAMQLQRLVPGLADSFGQLASQSVPTVVAADADSNTIRGVSTSQSVDAGVILIGAAIAIPNLLRSRIAANEASAVGKIRTVNTAEVTYQATYQRGYAPDLATLGSVAGGASAEHAGLIDDTIGNPGCRGNEWCTASGFRFNLKPVCRFGECSDFVVVATPADANTGSRSFCSTSDGVVRFKPGPPLAAAITAGQCHAWQPLQ